jgi:hypothetical protein
MSQMKIGCLMWYDSSMDEYGNINYQISKKYCDKYGYDLIKSSEKNYTDRTSHWERLPLILKNIDNYDYLIWIDADAHFYIDSPPITNLIEAHPDKLFIFSQDIDLLPNNVDINNIDNTKFFVANPYSEHSVVNSGVFIVKNSLKSKQILNEWGTSIDLFNKRYGFKHLRNRILYNDQGVLRLMLDKNIMNIRDESVTIDYGILQFFPNVDSNTFPRAIKECNSTEYGLKKQAFICHWTKYNHAGRVEQSIRYLESQCDVMKKYYDPHILMGKDVLLDIVEEIQKPNKKVLVFGLGYDSKIWYYANNEKNIWFLESNKEYINLNPYIEKKYIIHHEFTNINVVKSFTLTPSDIEKYPIPQELLKNAPYDIILIDGPTGYNNLQPGRLLPFYWSSKYLSNQNTIFYIDDTERKLETYCFNKYFNNVKILRKFYRLVNKNKCETIKCIKNTN